MRTKVMEISVGGFMLAGILALILLALNVSGLTVSDSAGSYRVTARFENIGGLAPRAKVTLSGVQIGQVRSIHIDERMLMAVVEMDINASADYLSRDSSAQILTAGLLGEQYIGIIPGADDEMLKDGDMIENTQSALVLENLVSKFLFNKVSE
ncbi:outer membrane lipid asymmetry maintenance protein MlaD [Marinobacterium nitratireducens]|uniref:Outer membrane lipid asymmetry maintenance protein MlaD n=1 Tax=Marinobacterium nitratireducens TaxID=518897 RepID=A0A917ZIQ3_9GAMM|nr:outer membrane lipid asymmetry maintenance protein MlaD [Marinobacterium nitratireducens]GGO82879.1 outer membrane lipid asymmetry maintenance protein MlaD [Marinobacterium nitratireducens]